MALLRGVLVSFDAGTWTAVVRLDGAQSQPLTGVKAARGTDAGEWLAGRRVLVDTGDHGDAGDIVAYAVYG